MPLLRERARTAAAPPTVAPRVTGWRRPVVVRTVPPGLLLVLGLVTLHRDAPFWYDEAYSRIAAKASVATLLSGVWHRTGVVSYLMDVPPSFNAPYYLLLHFWAQAFGTSEVALRAPSLLCTMAAVSVMAELGRRLGGPGAGLLTGLLCASGPLLVDEATQARDYGPAMLAVACCALFFQGWLDTGRGRRRVAATAVAAGLLHWFTIPVLVGLAVAALVCRRRRGGLAMALTLMVSCVPAGLLVGWSLLGGTAGAPSPAPVGLALPVHAVHDWAGESTVLAVALAAVALTGLWRSRHRVLLACWVLVPTVLVTALELLRPTYYPRYLLFGLLGLMLAAGLGVGSWRSTRLRVAAGTALVALSLSVAVPHLDDGAREPSPAVLALLATEQVAGEPIVPADGRTSLDLETYLADVAPRLQQDLVLPPVLFTDQTTSSTVWLVRVVLKQNSLPVVPAEQRLLDAGWAEQGSTLVVGTTTDLRVERWTR